MTAVSHAPGEFLLQDRVSSMDAQRFLHHLERSQLLSENQIKDAARRLDEEDVWKVADSLVSDGILTSFQSRQLLAGNCNGFLLGPYRILDQVGQGGTGIVYKAIHTKMRRLVAIKVLRPMVSTDKELHRHLFRREALAAAQLDHPNIVALYDADEARGVYFLVMEFVEGTNFKRLVQGYGPLAIPLACNVVCQVAEALRYAHERGFVHRDIKPSNMLLARLPGRQGDRNEVGNCLAAGPGKPGYRVKVLDFGLSRVCPEGHFLKDEVETLQAAPGVVWGTINYISPEQLIDVHAVDSRSDLYSIGSSLYYLLTGQAPYGEGSLAQRLIRRRTREPEAVSELRPGIPPAVAKIIERLMDRSPGNRFQTADELIEALTPWCTRESSGPIEERALQRKDQTDADIAINCGEDHPIMRSSELNESNPVVALPVRPPANTAKSKREPIWPPGFALAIIVFFAKKAAGSLLRALHSACRRTNEEAVKQILVNTVFGLRDIVNNLTRLKPLKSERYRVTIFGSARAKPGTLVYEEVKRVAAALADMGCDIITGGGPGLKQAANEGAATANAPECIRSVGIRVELPFEQEVNPFVEQAFEHKTFFSRLHHFVLTSDAFVVSPGGIGTVLELMMVWQLLQVKHVHDAPLILVGSMWAELVDWAKENLLKPELSLAGPEDMAIPRCVKTADEAIALLRDDHTKWRAKKSNYRSAREWKMAGLQRYLTTSLRQNPLDGGQQQSAGSGE